MSLHLRPARPTDAGRTGEILWENSQGQPWTAPLFSCAEAIACCGSIIDRDWMTVGLLDERVEAFLARDGQEIVSLYVARHVNGMGLGKLLLQDAMAREPVLHLHVHRDNRGALRFYRRLGFRNADSPSPRAVADMPEAVEMIWRQETPS